MSQKLKLNLDLGSMPTAPSTSSFVSDCVNKLKLGPRSLILELPSGIGRNTGALSETGATVIAADLDERVFEYSRRQHANSSAIFYARLDVQKTLPFAPHSFDLVVVVHMFYPSLFEILNPVLKPGGHLLLETFGAQGQNWRELPQKSEAENFFSFRSYEIIRMNQKDVKTKNKVTMKVLAKKPMSAS